MNVQESFIDPKTTRSAFSRFPSGVIALCAEIDGIKVGMAASSFVAVSIEPPLVAFCVQATSTTWPRLSRCRRLGISVLGETHDIAARKLSTKDGDRFEGIGTVTTGDGAVFVDDAAMWLGTSVVEEHVAGDHSIVVLRVHTIDVLEDISPIVYLKRTFCSLVEIAG